MYRSNILVKQNIMVAEDKREMGCGAIYVQLLTEVIQRSRAAK